MSWFARIFGKSRPVSAADAARPDATERRRKPSLAATPVSAKPRDPLRRKSDRAVRRDLLHTVVREAMLDLGVLSSHFKFKVMSLDQHGSQFLVMVDLSDEVSQDLTDLAAMELAIVQRALSHRKLVIKSVYWRMTDQAQVLPPDQRGAGHPQSQPAHAAAGVAARSGAQASDPEAVTASGFPITELPDGTVARPLGTTQYGELR